MSVELPCCNRINIHAPDCEVGKTEFLKSVRRNLDEPMSDAEKDKWDVYLSREWRTGYVLPDAGVKLEDVEYDLILQALLRAQWNESQAARLLGISRYALRYRMEKHLIVREKATRKNQNGGT